LARVCSLLEAGTAKEVEAHLERVPRRARVVGITGAPGAGKSTFTDALIAVLRTRGLRVAVLAVDPSSAKTGGALLGDRIRMERREGDAGVFIRSMATRGAMGGLAPSSWKLVRAMDAAGFDVVLVETVGVGQDEVDVARLAEHVVLLLAPGQGDEIQAIKAGVMEIADVYVINKADLAGADQLFHEIEGEVHSARPPNGVRPVRRVVAATGEGVEGVWDVIEKLERRLDTGMVDGGRGFAIDHIGIAVGSIDGALRFYEQALGMTLSSRETVEGERVRVAMLPAGESRLELLEAMDGESAIAKFLAKRGPGMHHVALRVPRLDEAVTRLRERGAKVLNEPRIGAGGHKYVFVHPAATGGVLLELIEEHS
jgi:LAO/AO transport system kinase